MLSINNENFIQKQKEKFLIKTNNIYHNKYTYILDNFKGMMSNILAICPKHGQFEINCHDHCRPNEHNRKECPECMKIKKEQQNDEKRKEKELIFINKVKEKYPQFNYSKIKYIKETSPVEIICETHGSFYVSPYNFLLGHTCKYCNQRNWTYTVDEFKEKANQIHNNKYDYSLITKINSIKDKQKIICPIHGIFKQSLRKHLNGQSCPLCSHASKPKSENEVKLIINKLYNNYFYFNNFHYINRKKPFIMTCPKHGDFKTNYNYFIDKKGGCPECNKEKYKEIKLKLYIDECKKYYGDYYDYSKTKWFNDEINHKVLVTCHHKDKNGNEHGDFYVNYKYHKIGRNVCPKCSKQYKHKIQEQILYNKLCEEFPNYNFKYSYWNNEILHGLQLDIYSEKYKIAIEYQGEQHFKIHKFNNTKEKLEKQIQRDLNKIKYCNENGIKLFHFTYLKNINNFDKYEIIQDENILYDKIRGVN